MANVFPIAQRLAYLSHLSPADLAYSVLVDASAGPREIAMAERLLELEDRPTEEGYDEMVVEYGLTIRDLHDTIAGLEQTIEDLKPLA